METIPDDEMPSLMAIPDDEMPSLMEWVLEAWQLERDHDMPGLVSFKEFEYEWLLKDNVKKHEN
jgi:hypothetical protein